jgi:hypothetical protein
MAHNGGIFQTGLNFLQVGGAYPFLNFLKTSQSAEIFNVGPPDPSNVDANGYIINTTGTEEFGGLFFRPLVADRSNKYVVKWTGGGATTTFNIGWLGTLTSGSNIGANGRFTVDMSDASGGGGRTILIWKNVSPNAPVTDVVFVHEDDEALYDAGNVFSPLLIQKFIDGGFGVLRNLDITNANTSNLSRFAHCTPVNAITYAGEICHHDIWAGETTKVGNAYTVAMPGFVLEHGAMVTVRWDTDGTSGATFTDTLNVQGTGAVPIRDRVGDTSTQSDARLMRAGKYSTLFYDADLAVWLKFGGDNDTLNRFITASVPPTIFLRLCKEAGMHPWIVQPYLSADPVTDLMPSLVEQAMDYVDSQASWMIPRFELVHNENWNNAAAFYGTRYGWNKANARWGSSFDTHNYHGRAFALNGQAIWTALGDSAKNPNRYHLVCGVQTFGSTSDSNPRLASTRHVLDGGQPASNYATHVACANYFSIRSSDYTQELILAMDYAAAGTELERTAIATEYVQLMSSYVDDLRTIYGAWKTWAAGHDVDGMEAYEGGYSADYTTSDLSSSITGIVRGATTRINTTGRLPVAGLDVTFSEIVGTTGLNGNTYTCLSVGAGFYIVDVDSTGMSNWVSGGVGVYENTEEPVNVLREAGRACIVVKEIARTNIENFFRAGGRAPSKFMFSGDSGANTAGQQIWAGLFPDIYGTVHPEMDLLAEMNEEANPINFSIQT